MVKKKAPGKVIIYWKRLIHSENAIKLKSMKPSPVWSPCTDFEMDKDPLYVKANIALYSLRHKNVPLHVKVLVLLLIAYVVSPIDFIPDFIPVLGLLDEAILVPIALTFITQLIPKETYNELQQRQQKQFKNKKMVAFGALLVIFIWLSLLIIVYGLWQYSIST